MISANELYPAFDNQGSPIVIESSGYFVPYLYIALDSILRTSNKENNYDIIILSCDISTLDEARLMQLVKDFSNVSLRICEPKQIVKKYMDESKFTYLEVNYYRMALPWILKNYDSAINLGADLLLNTDIYELTKIELKDDKMIAGVRDLGYIGRLETDIPQSELNLKIPLEYINADVLIFNLKAIRKSYSMDYVMEFWQKCEFRCAEQDALNLLFDTKKEILGFKWNVYPDRMSSTIDIMHAPLIYIREWKKNLNNPSIIHFAAVPKPWDYPLVGYGDKWWAIAKESIYYEEIFLRMCTKKYDKHTAFEEAVDILFPKGSKRRKRFSKFKPHKKWGLNQLKKGEVYE